MKSFVIQKMTFNIMSVNHGAVKGPYKKHLVQSPLINFVELSKRILQTLHTSFLYILIFRSDRSLCPCELINIIFCWQKEFEKVTLPYFHKMWVKG